MWFFCLPQAKRELQNKLDEVNAHLEQQVLITHIIRSYINAVN